VRVLLQDEHYNVTTTNYVPRTWDQIAALQPSLLLIDLSPRSQAGFELLEQLHAEGVTLRIPIIVTSTLPSILKRVEAKHDRYGGDKLVTKPLDLDALLEAIRTLIGPA
jgi:DNA-binding response OmpR family regulator